MPSDNRPFGDPYREKLERITEKLTVYALWLLRRRRCGPEGIDVGDLVSGAWCRAIQAKSKSSDWLEIEDEHNILSYVKRALNTYMVDLYRTTHTNIQFDNDRYDDNSEASASEAAKRSQDYSGVDEEEKAYLLAAIDEAIPDRRRRQIFKEQHIRDKSMEEIGKHLGIDKSTVCRSIKNGQKDPEIIAQIRRIFQCDGHDVTSFFL